MLNINNITIYNNIIFQFLQRKINNIKHQQTDNIYTGYVIKIFIHTFIRQSFIYLYNQSYKL